MRIGFFNSSLPEPAHKPGGVDIAVDRLACKLAARGHDVTFYTYSPPPPHGGYAHVQLEPRQDARARLKRLTAVPLRLNRIPTDRIDVLHLHGDDWFYFRRRVPTVRTFHGSAWFEGRFATSTKRRVSQPAVFGLEILASRLATASYGLIPGDGGPYRTVGHLGHAIDLPSDVEVERRGRPLVLFVGTWRGRKRGELLHDVFQREVRPVIPDAELVMVSDACDPGPGVRWLRRPSDAELQTLYRQATVFCLPSAYEGFGLPYLEAMAHATAVVATPNPGSRFILGDGRHGAVVDEARLGESLRDLLTNVARRSALAEAGRRRAADFSWDQVLDAHELAYERAVHAWRRPG
jgi:glycosyltransferase involved in cell wall biosynthesis